jgi:hypothetical protein
MLGIWERDSVKEKWRLKGLGSHKRLRPTTITGHFDICGGDSVKEKMALEANMLRYSR